MSRHVQASAPHHPHASASGCVYEHILVAERALGHFLPPRAQVHHVDENNRNNANRNLVICQDVAYHKLLHVRTNVRRAGGNPNTDKLCCDCRRPKPFAAFNLARANKSTGRQAMCRDCGKIRDAEKRRRRKAKAR